MDEIANYVSILIVTLALWFYMSLYYRRRTEGEARRNYIIKALLLVAIAMAIQLAGKYLDNFNREEELIYVFVGVGLASGLGMILSSRASHNPTTPGQKRWLLWSSILISTFWWLFVPYLGYVYIADYFNVDPISSAVITCVIFAALTIKEFIELDG